MRRVWERVFWSGLVWSGLGEERRGGGLQLQTGDQGGVSSCENYLQGISLNLPSQSIYQNQLEDARYCSLAVRLAHPGHNLRIPQVHFLARIGTHHEHY